ncbi:MAG: DUF4349 domain-containing protein [Acidobacteria bacterium]|nr:DUF4349 domain-containing protein [Acidobacteriota bacterium]
MTNKFRKGVFILIVGFLALFLFRLSYGYLSTTENTFIDTIQSSIDNTFEFSRKNYASEKFKVDRKSDNQSYNVDQKYEKIASLYTNTANFDQDEKKVRETITQFKALVQFEQNYGLKGSRRLNLAIGVAPESFDAFVEEIKKVGTISSIHINKTDKTNEYKDLNAKRVSLEKARESLIALKNKGGAVNELINLEDRILAIETEIQSTGIRLGEYDLENEFCTVKFGLEENQSVKKEISLSHRIKVALEWTIKYYLLLLAICFVGSLSILIGVTLLEKLNVVSSLIAKKQD